MPPKPLKPGNKAPHSGQYEKIGPRGGHTGEEVTGVKGRKLPPSSKPGQTYELVDPTKNGAGRG
ncbi:hypothetical protein AB0I30_08355 [Nocardia tengchongensis]|uniref:hypothetical protein n=1 Tax=Nocardia tengchongensis TaxID=2055889 RepID=UPI0033F80C1F